MLDAHLAPSAEHAPRLERDHAVPAVATAPTHAGVCRVAVLWIDWYAYHLARFAGLAHDPELAGAVVGLEMVGGIGVHAGLDFRARARGSLSIETLLPDSSWKDAGQLRLARAVWQRLGTLRPEVVLVPGYYTLPGLAAAAWARLHAAKSVLMTESAEQDHCRSWWKERVKAALVCGLFDWAVTGGKAHVRYLERLGFPPRRIAHFYDVVDNDSYREQTERLRRQPSPGLPRRFFLYVGRLAEEKNVDGLLRAYAAYRAAGGAWSLVLAGGGPEAPHLRALAASSSLGAEIHFMGHKSVEELLPCYAFAGALVLPSTREPWGLVVNEAMASGLPVIVSSRCGCAEDLVADGVNGFVFDPAREHDLARSLAAMERLSPAAAADMAACSRARIATYSPQNFGREIARIARS